MNEEAFWVGPWGALATVLSAAHESPGALVVTEELDAEIHGTRENASSP